MKSPANSSLPSHSVSILATWLSSLATRIPPPPAEGFSDSFPLRGLDTYAVASACRALATFRLCFVKVTIPLKRGTLWLTPQIL